MPDLGIYAILCLSAFLAGVMNSIAGGGTLLTFPALMSVISPAMANATSTVAIMPGSLAGTFGYRKEFATVLPLALRLIVPSFLGGLLGALLLVWYPNEFEALVPWLILAAAVLFMIQPPLLRLIKGKPKDVPHPPSTGTYLGVFMFQFVVATYGGYFGAGIGILMLTALGFMGVGDMNRMNAIKTFLATIINAVAVVIFICNNLVHWPYAIAMAVACILGGYAGARIARRLPSVYVRWLVIVIGLSLATYYALFAKKS